MILLVKLLLAHVLGDFFLQFQGWVRSKESHKWKSPYLYIHGIVHFILILVVFQSWSIWRIAAIIASTHLLIDGVKLTCQNAQTRRRWFFIDQGLHISVLVAVYAYIGKIDLSRKPLGVMP